MKKGFVRTAVIGGLLVPHFLLWGLLTYFVFALWFDPSARYNELGLTSVWPLVASGVAGLGLAALWLGVLTPDEKWGENRRRLWWFSLIGFCAWLGAAYFAVGTVWGMVLAFDDLLVRSQQEPTGMILFVGMAVCHFALLTFAATQLLKAVRLLWLGRSAYR